MISREVITVVVIGFAALLLTGLGAALVSDRAHERCDTSRENRWAHLALGLFLSAFGLLGALALILVLNGQTLFAVWP